jgi:hypothetical protein
VKIYCQRWWWITPNVVTAENFTFAAKVIFDHSLSPVIVEWFRAVARYQA